MNKEEKIKIVSDLTNCLAESKNIYFAEVSGLDAQQTGVLRRMCFDKGVSLSVVKNTLLRKAMDACDKDFSEFNDLLKGNTTLMISDVSNAPAQVIKNFLDKEEFTQPYKKLNLKGGHVEESVYIGDNILDILIALKSKEELLGDVITLLQSPMKNLLASLASSKQKLSGILTSLESNPKKDGSNLDKSSSELEESPVAEEIPSVEENKDLEGGDNTESKEDTDNKE